MADQGFFTLSLTNVESQPAEDPSAAVNFQRATDTTILLEKRGLVFPGNYRFDLPSFPAERALVCWIAPNRYRQCHSGIFTLTASQTLSESPIVLRQPSQWNARFTKWDDLAADFAALKQILTASPTVTVKESNELLSNFAEGRYDDVDTEATILAKTALLNVFVKMQRVAIPNQPGSNWFQFVQDILIVGRERFISLVSESLWTLVTGIFDNIDAHPDFVRADTLLHTGNIPDAYKPTVTQMVSIKSNDAHGNLQLTMAKAEDPVTGNAAYLLDADIDEDLEFFQHTRDLFVHLFSGGTHPFDIHEILTLRYAAPDLGYRLV